MEPLLPGVNQYFRELMCLAQGHNTLLSVGIEPRTSQFQVRCSTSTPPHSVSCFVHGSLDMRKLFFRVYAIKARVSIDTFYSNQTILQFCENWIDDLSTLTLFFSAIAGAIGSNKASLER